jgi:hypothetical protein
MASEPTEEAITNFVSFTSTTREQAITFLVGSSKYALIAFCESRLFPCTQKLAVMSFISPVSVTHLQKGYGLLACCACEGNNLDSQKAINAYFEDPTGSQLKVNLAMRNNSWLWSNISKPITSYWNDNTDACTITQLRACRIFEVRVDRFL